METPNQHTNVHHDRVTVSDMPLWYNRVSWGAILAGTAVALAVQVLLMLLGTAIGMTTINPASEANPMDGLATGGLIWWTITSIIAMFIGGWVSGRLANGTPADGLMHGAMVWALSTLLITTAMGRVVTGVGTMVGHGLALGTTAAVTAAANNDSPDEAMRSNGFNLDNIRQQAETLLRQTGKPELQPENLRAQAEDVADDTATTAQANANTAPAQQNANVDQLLQNLFREGQDTVQAVDREAMVNVLVARGQTQAEAERTVDGWIGTYQTARQQLKAAEAKARQAAEQAAETAAKAAMWAFIASLLGAIAAAIGGRMAIRTVETTRVTTTRNH
ncbi:TIGR04086 family membrane protein [Alkanindiges hydrocarboniclasticus]|jgi:hypothetical protein|nr:TIGR04086 family membrane protein [Alkanindiges hydrocarboniclasticus]